MVDLPKSGDRVPVKRFFVSRHNVRYDIEFGESEEDKKFIEHLRFSAIEEPFKARPEGDGFGVYQGRRRFLAKKPFTTHFVVGKDCLVINVSPDEAREASLKENLFRNDLDPVTRALNLNVIMSRGGGGLRATARRLGLKASTLSEWLGALKLTENLQRLLSKREIVWSDARKIVRMNLSEEMQNRLVEIIDNEGVEAFKKELEKIKPKKGRGLPKDAYDVFRVTWKKANKFELRYSENIRLAAKNKEMSEAEYIKRFLIDHMKEIEEDIKL